jgi:hypothetical protein
MPCMTSSHIDSRLDFMTCFSQWFISKHEHAEAWNDVNIRPALPLVAGNSTISMWKSCSLPGKRS